MRKLTLGLLTASALVGAAHAQTVQQSGNVIAGHIACWTATGVIYDCGPNQFQPTPGPQVIQSGTVTAGHLATWTATGTIQDGGAITTPANTITVGSTVVSGATNGYLLYNNGSVLGAESLASLLVSPPAIGGTTPSTGAFTTLLSTGGITGAIGGATPSTGAFTTLLSTGGITGAIGGATPSTGAFTTLSATGAITGGANGGTGGSLALNGSTSGKLTQTVPAAAGSAAIAWGTNSGTPAVTVGPGLGLSTTTGNLTLLSLMPGGRLTLQSGVPVMTTTQSAQTTIYYAPYSSEWVPIYNGTSDQLYQFTSSASDTVGQSLALGSNWAANSVFDVFEEAATGSAALCTVAWTNTTTRATALAVYNGRLTNATSATCRTSNSATITLGANQGTYVGSFYTNGSTGTVDWIYGGSASGGSAGSFGVWNYYNRVSFSSLVLDSGSSYTYTTATVRQARASTGNQIKFMVGAVEDSIMAAYNTSINTTANSGSYGEAGIGLNTTIGLNCAGLLALANTTLAFQITAGMSCSLNPALGVNILSANEIGDGTHANNFDVQTLNTLTGQFRM